MELIIVAVISSIAGLMGLVYLDKSFYRRLQWKRDYEREMIKLKKRESRKDKKLAATINTSPPSTKGETIRNLIGALDNDTVQNLISTFTGEQAETDKGDIVESLIDMATKNPEIVQGLIQGLSKGKSSDNNIYE